MILIVDLFAPTVPSEPNPQNFAWKVPGRVKSNVGPNGKDKCVTSSVIPMVNLLFCSLRGFCNSSKTAKICAGVTSFEPKP